MCPQILNGVVLTAADPVLLTSHFQLQMANFLYMSSHFPGRGDFLFAASVGAFNGTRESCSAWRHPPGPGVQVRWSTVILSFPFL